MDSSLYLMRVQEKTDTISVTFLLTRQTITSGVGPSLLLMKITSPLSHKSPMCP